MLKIADKTFRTKNEAQVYFSEILNRNEVGSELTGADLRDVCELINNHHNAAEKIGAGIEKILVKKTRWGNAHRFVILRKDGSEEAFSYRACLGGKRDVSGKFGAACRRAVHRDIHRWKVKQIVPPKNQSMLRCVATGALISFEAAQVDHKPPLTFSVIVKAFVQARKIDTASLEYFTDEHGLEVLVDGALVEDFRQFHKEMAVLRILSKEANLKSASKGRIKPTKSDGTLV